MGLSFFAPLILGGIAFLGIPWLVHQIRRPERETMLFSSLMFVPDMHRKTIERQSLQHILLMLLRMLLLLLLAFAFSRPYWSFLNPVQQETDGAHHVILIDVSASMNAGSRMNQAKQQAQKILDSIDTSNRIALVSFSHTPTVLTPFPALHQGSTVNRETIRREIKSLNAGYHSTSFLPALQKAVEILNANQNSTEDWEYRQVIHFISDFQKIGLPEKTQSWKLSPGIDFKPVHIGGDAANRFSIQDVVVRKTHSNGFLVLGQIKNESSQDTVPCQVHLSINDSIVENRELTIPAGYTSKITFQVNQPSHNHFAGWIEIENDDFSLDNRRYFAWNPQPPKTVWLVSDSDPNQQWPSSWFVSRALQIDDNQHWMLKNKNPQSLQQAISNSAQPDILLLCGMKGLDQAGVSSILRFIQEGGKAFLMLDEGSTAPIYDNFFQTFGMQIKGLRYSEANGEERETFTWIDFDHPVFFPFRGIQYNDFTSIYFTNYVVVETENRGIQPDSKAKVLAKFEESHPAVIDNHLGKGRLLLWTFSPGLNWTNLPKNPRFVPLLFESLNELGGRDKLISTFHVNDTITKLPTDLYSGRSWTVLFPGQNTLRTFTSEELRNEPIRLDTPGLVQWNPQSSQDQPIALAVNLDIKEMDFSTVPIDQFQQIMISARQNDVPLTPNEFQQEGKRGTHREWGRFLLFVFLIGLVVEMFYAAKLTRKPSHSEVEQGGS